MQYEVEVRSLLDGGWARRCYIVDAETGDEAAALGKARAARKLPRASVHLSYVVRPADDEVVKAAAREAKSASAARTKTKKSRAA